MSFCHQAGYYDISRTMSLKKAIAIMVNSRKTPARCAISMKRSCKGFPVKTSSE
jgi:hypothetical protein